MNADCWHDWHPYTWTSATPWYTCHKCGQQIIIERFGWRYLWKTQ